MPRKRNAETEDARALRRVERRLKVLRQWIAAEREGFALRELMRETLRKSRKRAMDAKLHKALMAKSPYR